MFKIDNRYLQFSIGWIHRDPTTFLERCFLIGFFLCSIDWFAIENKFGRNHFAVHARNTRETGRYLGTPSNEVDLLDCLDVWRSSFEHIKRITRVVQPSKNSFFTCILIKMRWKEEFLVSYTTLMALSLCPKDERQISKLSRKSASFKCIPK